jgi:4-amino-4-deoxy-L-arabinose transferase-like glycosyltransferase
LIFMLAILLLASVFYLRDIYAVSLWEDESWMAIAISGDLPHVWTFAAERGVHPPLYFYLGWFTTRLTGDGEVALRWLAGLGALAGIALTYRLGADWFGRRAGVYAAALAAGSLFLIYFGRLARHYTLFFALAAALVLVYVRWLRYRTPSPGPSPTSRGREKNTANAASSPPLRVRGGGRVEGLRDYSFLVAVALLQAALLYTHYFGAWMALVIGAHGLMYLHGRDRLRLIAALGLSALLFIPWIPSLLQQLNQEGSLGYGTRVAEHALGAYLDRVFNGSYAFGIVLAALGVVAVWRWRKTQAGVMLVLWLALPISLSLLLNTRFVWFVERNMIFTLSAAYILFGAGLAWLAQHRTGQVLAVLAALAFITLGPIRYADFWPFVTPAWRDMANAVAWDSRPDDLYVINAEPYSMTYYLRRFMGTAPELTPVRDWLAQPIFADRMWMIDASWAVREEALDALPVNMVQTRRHVLGNLVTEFYQRAPEETVTMFGEQIALGVVALPEQAVPGQRLTLDLWWRAVRQPDTDYSVGVYLLAPDGRTVAQQDGGFDRGQVSALALPLDRWTPDARSLDVPADAPPGDYTLLVAVYDWRDGTRLTPENGRQDNGYVLGVVTIS